MTQVSQALHKAHVSWQGGCAETPQDPQVGFEPGKQTLGAILRHVPTGVFFLGMLDIVMLIARQGPRGARRVRVEPPARLDRQVGRLLPRLDRAICGRLEDDRPLPADPRDNGGPIFVLRTPTGLALLAAPPRTAAQRLLPALRRLPLGARGVGEVLRIHRACELARHLGGHGRMAEPPAPARARAAMAPHLPRHAPGRPGKAPQAGRQSPGRERSRALVQQGRGEVVAGALAAGAPGALTPGPIVVLAPRIDIVTVAPGTLEWAICPPP